MLPGLFIVGLVAFLPAHLAYLALLRRDTPWLASTRALAGTLAAAAGVYAVLWAGGLAEGLRLPAAVNTGVIALMAAQALGHARTIAGAAAGSVAIGACCFMLSDGLLAYNRLVQPRPAAQLAVLGRHCAA